MEFIERNVKKIEPFVKEDCSTKDIEMVLEHLKKAREIIEKNVEQGSVIAKFAKAENNLFYLKDVEAEIKKAKDQLIIFLNVTNLIMHCNTVECQNQKLDTITMMVVNNKVGISTITDSSIRRPSAPPGLTIQENKNKLKLSWKPCEGIVDDYEVCYNENDNLVLFVGNVTAVEIGFPRVLSGKVYTMKVRGVNKGGTGEWSKSVVGQIIKPFPQKPTIMTFPSNQLQQLSLQNFQ